MDSAVARQCPGTKALFIRGMRFPLPVSSMDEFGWVSRGS